MSTRAKVAVLWSRPETVLEDYIRAFELAEGPLHLDLERTTILKDNISWHYPLPGANTTPWQLEGSILALRKHGFDSLSCVQNKTVVIDTFKGEDLNHYLPILQHYNVPVFYNFKDADMRWIPYEPQGEMLALNKVYPHGIRLPDYFFGKNIVHLPTCKCHIYTTTTGAMKNAFGGLLSTHRHYTHTWIHETLVDLLTIQKEIHSGIFAFMDGTTAGNGTGPRIMTPVRKDIILASADQVAIDAVSAKLMGFDPLNLGYIRLAHERGLGVGDPAQIEVVGDDISDENWDFSIGLNLHRALGWLSWYGPTKALQKILFHTPLVKIPIFVSEAYHDYYRWPLVEKKLYENWREESPWGRLFVDYERRGVLRGC